MWLGQTGLDAPSVRKLHTKSLSANIKSVPEPIQNEVPLTVCQWVMPRNEGTEAEDYKHSVLKSSLSDCMIPGKFGMLYCSMFGILNLPCSTSSEACLILLNSNLYGMDHWLKSHWGKCNVY